MQYLETMLSRYNFKQILSTIMSKRGCSVLVKQQRFKTKPIKYSTQALPEELSFIDESLMLIIQSSLIKDSIIKTIVFYIYSSNHGVLIFTLKFKKKVIGFIFQKACRFLCYMRCK